MSLNTLPTLTEGSTPYQVPLLLSRDRQTHFIFSDRGPGLGGRDQERDKSSLTGPSSLSSYC